MAIKHICDRCGKEISVANKPTICTIKREPNGAPIRISELCPSCALWLERYLANNADVDWRKSK